MRGQRVFRAAVLIGLGTLAGLGIAAGGGQRTLSLDHLIVRRLDIVDARGVVRLTAASPVPDPVMGGRTYKRKFSGSGILLYDANGDERGGLGVQDIPGSAVAIALDHANNDAIGWRVMPDGSVSFIVNERGALKKDAAGRMLPNPQAATRFKLSVAADGTPTLALNDRDSHPRVRISVSKEGYGEIEFLDAQGRVLSTLAPERTRR